jgi:hypothetical protein
MLFADHRPLSAAVPAVQKSAEKEGVPRRSWRIHAAQEFLHPIKLGLRHRRLVLTLVEAASVRDDASVGGEVAQTPIPAMTRRRALRDDLDVVAAAENRGRLQPARVVPFEEAQAQVAQDLARIDVAAVAARAQAEEVSRAIAEGRSLVDVAREKGLSIVRPEAFRRRPDGYVPQLGVAPEIVSAAFTLSPEKPSDPTLHPAGENVFVLIELLEKKTPSEDELARNLAPLRERLAEQRRAEVESLWLSELRQRLAEDRALVYDLAAFRE